MIVPLRSEEPVSAEERAADVVRFIAGGLLPLPALASTGLLDDGFEIEAGSFSPSACEGPAVSMGFIPSRHIKHRGRRQAANWIRHRMAVIDEAMRKSPQHGREMLLKVLEEVEG